MGEVWKDVVGYEGYYEVSNLGNVRNYNTKSLLSQVVTDSGYRRVGLYKNGKTEMKVHRIVAIAFIPNKDDKPYINHKDGNKDNNTVDNLEWCTQRENIKHAWETGLRKKMDIDESKVIDMYVVKKCPVKVIARSFGVSITPIKRILKENNIRIKDTGKARSDYNKSKGEFIYE